MLKQNLGPPSAPLEHQTLENRTMSSFVCPARPFPYQCALDSSHFESTAHTSSNSFGVSIGMSTVVSLIGGVALLGYVHATYIIMPSIISIQQ